MKSKRRKIISIIAAFVTLLIGASVIVGWLIHNDFLRYLIIIPGAVKMKFNVALGFIFSSVVLLLSYLPVKTKASHQISICLCITIFLIGLLTIGEYIFGINIGIDELFAKDELPTTASYYAGRMSPISAINFILISFGLLSLDKEKAAIYQFVYLSFIAFISIVALIGVNFINDIPTFIRLAVHASVGFFVLSVAIYYAQPALQQKISFEQRLITGFVASIILIGVISALSIIYTDKLIDTSKSVERTKNILSESEQTLSLVKDIESGGRGYIITRDSAYLANFIVARNNIYVHLDNLKALTMGHESQQVLDSLSAYIDARIAFSLELIRLRNENGFEAAYQLVMTRKGNFITDKIRGLITSLQRDENDSLIQKQKLNSKSNADFNNAFRTLLASVVILLTVVFFTVRSNLAARVKSEKHAVENEEQIQTMFKTAPDAVIVIDPKGVILRWNTKAEMLFGWKAEEVIGKLLSETIVPHRYREAHQKGLNHFLSTGEGSVLNTTIEIQALQKNNTEFDVALSISPIILKDRYFFIGFIRDITKEKKAEEEIKQLNAVLEQRVADRTALLQKAEANYREIFDKATDAIYVHEIGTGKVIQANHRATEITGYSKEELLTIDPQEFINGHPDYTFQHAIGYIQKAAIGQAQHFEWLGKNKNGSHNWFEVNLKRANIAGEERILAFFREINDRKKAQLEIEDFNKKLETKVMKRTEELTRVNKELEINIKHVKESEEKFSKIFDANLVGISISMLPSGIMIDVNKSLLKMYGFKQEEVIGHTAVELNMVSGDVRKQILEQLMQGETFHNREIMVRNKSGTEFPVLFSIDNFTMMDKQFVITFSYDLTDRKKAEQKISQLNIDLGANLQQLEAANKEMESFTYSVSHDLRSPLRAIDGYSKMLEEEFLNVLGAEGKRFLTTIQHNAKKMGALIDDLLAFSHLGKKDLQKTTVNMKELAENVFHEISNSLNHKAKVKIGSLQPVLADQSLINQVFVNLLSNAIKYSSKTEYPLIEVKSKVNDAEIIYSVKDNGVGFDMQYADKLFGVFQRLHKANEFDGTGVGLAIAHRIVNKHGGKIWADAKLGEGATFFFSLPINKQN
ncbi:MAG: PAS domain S-box protein [Chryseolinea sp.]